jgi:hypothetical protein
MEMNRRTMNIAFIFNSIRRLGTSFMTDYMIKCHASNEALEQLIQGLAMQEQDKFILSLPVWQIFEDAPRRLTEMDALRDAPPPVLEKKENDERILRSLTVNDDPEGPELGIEELLTALNDWQRCGGDHEI